MTGQYTHYSIISDQRTPTLAPLLDDHYPPKAFVAIVTPEQENQKGFLNLEALIKKQGIAVRRLQVPSAWDTDSVQSVLDADLSRLAVDAHPILNATGGTKPLSTGAFLGCFNRDVPVYYVNIDTLHWLYSAPSDDGAGPLPLASHIKIKQILAIHGVDELSRQQHNNLPRGFTHLTQLWLERAGDKNFMRDIGQLNWYANKAERQGVTRLAIDSNKHQCIKYLLGELEDQNIASCHDGVIDFRNEDNRFFCNGGWLEQAAYRVLQSIKANKPELGIQDIACSLRIRNTGKGREHAEQELDLAVLMRNRLYVIECKTAALASDNKRGESKAEDALFKLAAIQKNLAGNATRGLLLSFRTVRRADKNRAPILGLQVADADKLADLRGTLLHWLQSAAR